MINENYLRRKDTSYLFAGVMTKARAFSGANPEAKLIYLNRTDVALPLSSTVTGALSAAAESAPRAKGRPILSGDTGRKRVMLFSERRSVAIMLQEGSRSNPARFLPLRVPKKR